MGDVYPKASKLPKGDYTLQLYLRYEIKIDKLANHILCLSNSCLKGGRVGCFSMNFLLTRIMQYLRIGVDAADI